MISFASLLVELNLVDEVFAISLEFIHAYILINPNDNNQLGGNKFFSRWSYPLQH